MLMKSALAGTAAPTNSSAASVEANIVRRYLIGKPSKNDILVSLAVVASRRTANATRFMESCHTGKNKSTVREEQARG
jgi:hypothetical protein